MKENRIALVLFSAGVAIVVAAIFWSLYAYGQIGGLVAAKGLRPNSIFSCLFSFSERCGQLAVAHTERGTTAYSPMVFWLGVVAILASFILNLRKHGSMEGWGPRLQRVLIPVDQVSTFVGQMFAWCIVVLTLAVAYEVFSRYVLRSPTTWAFDASYILYGALFIMAGAYALSRNSHVRGDFLYRTWRPRRQALMDLILYFLFFFPGIIAFIYSGYGFAAQSWMTHEHSAYSPDGLPVYQYKTLIPTTGVLLLLQGIVEVIRCIICLRSGEWPQRLHDVEELEKVLLEERGVHVPPRRRTHMTDPQLGVLMLVLFIFLIMLGFPIAFTLMAMGVGFAFLAYDGNMDAVASLLVQRTWSVMTNDVPDLGSTFCLHGLHRRAREYSRSAFSIDPTGLGCVARIARHRNAHNLRAVCDGHRDCRRRRNAYGAPGISGDAAARL